MDSHEASEIVQAYLKVHLGLPDGLKDEAVLPYAKPMIAEALRCGLSRDERSSIDDELMRGVYLSLSDYQPPPSEVLRHLVAEERSRRLAELKPFPERPVPEEFRRKLREMFPPKQEQLA